MAQSHILATMSRYFPVDKSPRELCSADLPRLKHVAEGWFCEYKRELVKAVAIAKSVSAFANSHGGWIFYGIEEDKATRCASSAPGISVADISQAEVTLRQAVSGAINPTPYYEHVVLHGPLPELGLVEDRAVLAVFVPEGVNAPYLHSSGRIYRRVGDESDPKAETDRHLMDMLFRRSKGQRKRVRDAIRKQPERSPEEKNAPCLRVLIFTDLWGENTEREDLEFSKFRDIMRAGAIAFDNFYVTTFGHLARMTFGNKPNRMVYSWHHEGWFEEVLFPFTWFTIPTTGLPHAQYSGFEIMEEFLAKCRAANLDSLPAIEISGLFQSIVGICHKLKEILDMSSSPSALYFKIQLSGIWRCVPFLDVPHYLTFIEANGIPVTQEGIAYGPPGTSVESLGRLRLWTDEASDQAVEGALTQAGVLNAITIFREVCRCLGLPPEGAGLQATTPEEVSLQYSALCDAAVRSSSIVRKILGLERY
jgi:hypothetical protein